MFSACGSTNPYGGKINIKRKLFSKRKTHSKESDGGMDLKKVKGKHCVETWASHYVQNTSNNHEIQPNNDYQDNHINKINLSKAVDNESLVNLEKSGETKLIFSVELNKVKECLVEKPEDISRYNCYKLCTPVEKMFLTLEIEN